MARLKNIGIPVLQINTGDDFDTFVSSVNQ